MKKALRRSVGGDLSPNYETFANHHFEEIVQLLEEFTDRELEISVQLQAYEHEQKQEEKGKGGATIIVDNDFYEHTTKDYQQPRLRCSAEHALTTRTTISPGTPV